MTRIASQAGWGVIGGGTQLLAQVPAQVSALAAGSPSHRHRVRLRGQIDAMWRNGMSTTAIRRALGLSAEEAVAAGIVAPAVSGVGSGAARPGRPRHPKGPRETGPGGGAPREAAQSSQAGPAMTSVLKAVAQVTQVPAAQVLGPGQERGLVRPRQLTMYLLRALCAGASLPAIGHFLGRDHTTVLYGCRRAEDLLARDAGFRRWRDGALQVLAAGPDGGSLAHSPVQGAAPQGSAPQ